jgi:hypothetical protein
MDTFPIVKRKDEAKYGEYRTKRVILEIYDEMQKAIETGKAYQTRLNPPPADPAVAHPPRQSVYTKAEVERGKIVAYITLLLHLWKNRVSREVLDHSLILLLNDDVRRVLAGQKVKLDPDVKFAPSLDSTLTNMAENQAIELVTSGNGQTVGIGSKARPLNEFPSGMQDAARETIAVYGKLRDAEQLAYLERVGNDKFILVQDGLAAV